MRTRSIKPSPGSTLTLPQSISLQTERHTDYDQIAPSYDQRYERNQYAAMERFLRRFTGDQTGLRLLEVGCGTGHWLEALQAPEQSVIGLDASAGMLAKARERTPGVPLIRGEAGHLPLPEGSFDRVFCVNALHHFPDKFQFLAEVRRVLRRGGRFLSAGLDPHRGADTWHIYDYFEQSLAIDKQRYPSSEMLREWMVVAGFEDCLTQEVEHWSIRIPGREALAQGRLDKAATSQLSVLTQAEYEQGIRRIHEDIECAEREGRTLFLTIDLTLYGTTGTVR